MSPAQRTVKVVEEQERTATMDDGGTGRNRPPKEFGDDAAVEADCITSTEATWWSGDLGI